VEIGGYIWNISKLAPLISFRPGQNFPQNFLRSLSKLFIWRLVVGLLVLDSGGKASVGWVVKIECVCCLGCLVHLRSCSFLLGAVLFRGGFVMMKNCLLDSKKSNFASCPSEKLKIFPIKMGYGKLTV